LRLCIFAVNKQMKHLKIGIVEDDLIIAASIEMTLAQIGYQPITPVRNYSDALKMIAEETPDLLLLDITLEGKEDGIELAQKVNEDYGIPFIFLTSYSDPATVNRAKQANPYAYLVKPFNESDLFSAIEIAFNNYNRELKTSRVQSHPATQLRSDIFIKEGDIFHKVKLQDILYVESDNVYLHLYTNLKHYIARIKLDDFLHDFSGDDFFRVHRSYAVNLNHLEAINSVTLKVAGKEIPLQKNYRQELMDKVKSLS